MVIIDHRRHAVRSKPGDHLSQSGVDLARRVRSGDFGDVPSYDLVITSTVARAFETSIAMGFAVNEQVDFLSTMGDAVLLEYPWPLDIGNAARILLGKGPAAEFAVRQAHLLRSIARRLPSDGAALVISHGGVVESGAIALRPDADHQSWGPAIGYLEGIRLVFDSYACVGDEVLRVGADDYLVTN